MTATVSGSAASAGRSQRSAMKRGVEALRAWIVESRTVQMFRNDRLLLAGFVVLSVSAWVPMFVTPILPLVDLGVNVGASGLIPQVLFGKGVVAEHYFVNFQLIPYWTVYLFMAFVSAVAGPFVSAKVTVGLALALLPLSVMRLMRAFGRDPRLGLWAFVLSWDRNLYWGWITFQLGMALCLWTLAKIFEARSLRAALRCLPLTLAIAITHVHAVVLTLVAGGLLTFVKRPLKKSFPIHALALSGCVLLIAPWLWSKFGSGPQGGHGSLSMVMHPMETRLGNLYSYTLDVITDAHGGDPPSILRIAFIVLLLGPALFLLVAPRPVSPAQRAAPAAFLFATAGLYLLVPFELSGPIVHWWTYPRFGTYVLFALLLLPRPRLDGLRALWLAPGLLSAFLLHRAVQTQFRAYSEFVSPYMQIVAALPPNQLMLPLDLEGYRFKQTHDGVIGQIHGYTAVAKSCFDPHLFDELNNPLRFVRSNMPPVVNWGDQASFDFNRVGKPYDYIIVYPTDMDPFTRRWKDQVELVKDAAPWRLYRVKR